MAADCEEQQAAEARAMVETPKQAEEVVCGAHPTVERDDGGLI